MRRTRQNDQAMQAWADWVADLGEWHVFGGLTYDPKRCRVDTRWKAPIPPGNDVVKLHARQWLREGQRRLGRQLEAAVLALEYQKSGWPHLHPLVRVAGGLQGNEFKTLGGAWYERHGYARLEHPRDRAAVTAYASKYLVKDLHRGDVVLWPLSGSLSSHQHGLGLPAPGAG